MRWFFWNKVKIITVTNCSKIKNRTTSQQDGTDKTSHFLSG